MILRFVLPLLAYLLGSIPWALIVTRVFGHGDIRQKGSGNMGATNVRRVAGTTPALLTLAGDLMKGAVPVWIALIMTKHNGVEEELYPCLVALSALVGHLFPLYLKFKNGGKGVATAFGSFLILSPFACLTALIVFVLIIRFTNRVSAGSLSAALILPVAVWVSTRSIFLASYAVITATLIYIRHQENIKRLLSGNEPMLFKKKHDN